MTPSISVCVANYNNARFLRPCLDSILGQTFSEFEVVVVDDASTDESREVLSTYRDTRLRVHHNDANLGVAAVRNVALELSRGEYITSLDADDVYFSPRKLERELSTIHVHRDRLRDPIAFSDVMLINTDGSDQLQVGKREIIMVGRIFRPMLDRSIMIPRDYLCTKAQIEAAGGFNETLPIFEDWDLKLRLALRHEFVFSGLIGIGYRRHGLGLSEAPEAYKDLWMQKVRAQHE